MTGDRRERIEQLFADALDRPPAQRAAYLSQVVEDEAVRAEVLSLLEAHEARGRLDSIAERLGKSDETYTSSRATALLDRMRAALTERYHIERELGRGGMAIVFLAEDPKHHRRVAIKVLKPELSQSLGSERFLREIQIAALLNHPHILPLHDSGEANGLIYYVMPYVEGESLRDRLDREKQLSLEDAVRIVRDVADALTHAHSLGVVHRDIKPDNILLSAGRAIVSDFGIARAMDVAGTERLTESGLALGTPAYMSPEQIGGDQALLDGRGDLYSLACVAYEMLGGAPPFTGPSPQAVLARHSVDPVPPLRTVRGTVSRDLERVVERALAKAPADRFRTAVQFAEAFERAAASEAEAPALARVRYRHRTVAAGTLLALAIGGAGWWALGRVSGVDSSRIGSLAVLPLENLTGNPEQEYFVAGMHDALIGELAQIGALRVTSRTSAARYKNSGKSVPEIARELRVDAIVEASVSRAGDSVRFQVQLIQAHPEERNRWAQSYQADLRGVLAMQKDVAGAIAREINVQLTPAGASRLGTDRPVNPETYEAYLRGMFHINKFTPEGFDKGLTYLNEAIDKDPADPMPYAALALAYTRIGHGSGARRDAFARAKAAASRALALDETMSEAHEALAEIQLYYDWDFAAAERSFKRVLELNPSLPDAHSNLAWTYDLLGPKAKALAQMRQAQEVDPLAPIHAVWLGWLYWEDGHYQEAMEEVRKAVDLNPNFPWGNYLLARIYEARNQYPEAIAAQRKATAANPELAWGLAHTLALAGQTGEARKLADAMKKQPTPLQMWGLGQVYVALGDKDEALRWLEAAFQARWNWMPWILKEPAFRPLRDDPRFRNLVSRINPPQTS
jgi:eukaryotic-like serine/threonine-protein kinase